MVAHHESRFFISATWQEYLKYLEAVGDRPIRVTFDRGRLELLSPSPAHERAKKLLATLLEALLADWNLDYEALGSTTFRREDLERGLEPDECYWLREAAYVRTLLELDLTRDPAPELVIEIEITSSILNRLSLFHAMKVTEIWRLTRKGELVVLGWTPEGYAVLPLSAVVSGLPASAISQFLEPRDCPRPQLIREFLNWARPYRAV